MVIEVLMNEDAPVALDHPLAARLVEHAAPLHRLLAHVPNVRQHRVQLRAAYSLPSLPVRCNALFDGLSGLHELRHVGETKAREEALGLDRRHIAVLG